MTNLITKREVLDAANRGEGSLGKAADDEPVFVLRAQDLIAPGTLRVWIDELTKYAKGRGGKIVDANDVYVSMVNWQGGVYSKKTKIPD